MSASVPRLRTHFSHSPTTPPIRTRLLSSSLLQPRPPRRHSLSIKIRSTTIANGVNILTGCFSVNGTCIANSSFSTTSATYWLSQNTGNAFSTTSASAFLALNQGFAFSTTSAALVATPAARHQRTTSSSMPPPPTSSRPPPHQPTSSTNASFGTLKLPNLGNAILSTNATGAVVASSSIGVNYLTGTLGVGNGGTGAPA